MLINDAKVCEVAYNWTMHIRIKRRVSGMTLPYHRFTGGPVKS